MSAPATPGIALEAVDTPALIVELDAFERNLARLMQTIDGRGVRLRAHAKTHKCAEIARRQVAAGAIGVCCQKVSEAEAMVAGGIEDVVVSNEVVGERKLARLAALARRARIGVCVDDAGNMDALSVAAFHDGMLPAAPDISISTAAIPIPGWEIVSALSPGLPISRAMEPPFISRLRYNDSLHMRMMQHYTSISMIGQVRII